MIVWRFGTFELDAASGELRKAGRRVHLAEQPARALLLLVSRAGEIVSREELQRHLWGDATFVHFPSSLAFCLGRIRLALGDDARSPRFVETIPRRGYRFLAPVQRAEAYPVAPPRAARPSARGWQPWLRRTAAGVVVAAALLESTGVRIAAHTRSDAAPGALAAFERGQRLASGDVLERRKSVYAYRDAIREDPLFAEAHYALADVYLCLGEQGDLGFVTALAEARRHAKTALALEEAPGSHLVLGSTQWFLDWDWKGARREFESALRLAPDSDAALVAYARYLSAIGSDAEAMRVIDSAEARTPGCDLVAHESGAIRYRARRYEDAVRKFELAASLGPPRGRTSQDWLISNRFLVFRVHAQQRAWAEAQRDAVEIARLATGTADGGHRLAALAPREAFQRFATASVEYMTRLSERQYVAHTELARVLALAGDHGRALELLEAAASEREPMFVYSLRDPDFDGIRHTARFAGLLARLGAGARATPAALTE